MDSAPSSGWSSRCDAHPAAPHSHIGNIHRDVGSFSGWAHWAYNVDVDNPLDISMVLRSVSAPTRYFGRKTIFTLVLMITMVSVLPILRRVANAKVDKKAGNFEPKRGQTTMGFKKREKVSSSLRKSKMEVLIEKHICYPIIGFIGCKGTFGTV